MSWLEHLHRIAQAALPNEACGLVVARGKKAVLHEARNVSATPTQAFEIHADAWGSLRPQDEVIGIYHSHPMGSAAPSMADLAMVEATELPWHIVGVPRQDYQLVRPSGYEAPYIGRPYVYGVHDCYGLVRDWYQRERALALAQVPRRGAWWTRGEDRLRLECGPMGFVAVPEREPLALGDVLLIQLKASVPDHLALFIGEGRILHHCAGRLSRIDGYGGLWQRHTVARLRHAGSPTPSSTPSPAPSFHSFNAFNEKRGIRSW